MTIDKIIHEKVHYVSNREAAKLSDTIKLTSDKTEIS